MSEQTKIRIFAVIVFTVFIGGAYLMSKSEKNDHKQFYEYYRHHHY